MALSLQHWQARDVGLSCVSSSNFCNLLLLHRWSPALWHEDCAAGHDDRHCECYYLLPSCKYAAFVPLLSLPAGLRRSVLVFGILYTQACLLNRCCTQAVWHIALKHLNTIVKACTEVLRSCTLKKCTLSLCQCRVSRRRRSGAGRRNVSQNLCKALRRICGSCMLSSVSLC